jgi:arylsulfatase A-like enzyme
VIEGGRTVTAALSHVDVLPTLLRACSQRAASPEGLDGRDVFDILAGKSGGAELQRDVYSFTGQAGPEREELAILSHDGWKLIIRGPDVRRQRGYRTPRHQVELYHLSADPLEQTNLADREAERVTVLGEKLLKFRRSEPEEAIVETPQPEGFRPPPDWRNPLETAR